MKNIIFVGVGFVLATAVFAGGNAAMAALVPLQSEGHKTMTAENAEGKFLVVAGKAVPVTDREDLINYWYVRTNEVLSRVNSIPVSECENPYQDQIERLSADVAEISAGVGAI